jgi:hypothetical protein
MPPSKKQDVNLPFPVNGVFEARPYDQQPERTTTDSKNVVSFDVGEDKQRGGQRLGITKATPTTEEGGGLGTNRVQLLDVVPVGNETIGYLGGVVVFNNSSDAGVPDGTPCNLTELAIDPNQDGEVDDILGDIAPAPITGNASNFPIPMFECTSLTPPPTEAGFSDNAYEQGRGPVGAQHALIPVGDHGPVNTWNTSSPGLWHVKTCGDKRGCIYPRAPFDKSVTTNELDVFLIGGVGGGTGTNKPLAATYAGSRAPSFYTAESPTDLPLGMFGGGTANNPTQTTYVSSVLLPTQSETEDSFNSNASRDWALTCDVFTPYKDQIDGGDARAQYKSVTGSAKINAELTVNREYYYGFIFKMQATVSHETTNINSDAEEERCLFVGFHQSPDSTKTIASEKPVLKIGTIDNTDNNQISLVNERVVDTASLDYRTWYSLDLRCVNGFLEVRLNGVGPLPDANDVTETKFKLADILGDEVDGDTFEATRSRSGLLFWRSSSVGIGHVNLRYPTYSASTDEVVGNPNFSPTQTNSDFGLAYRRNDNTYLQNPMENTGGPFDGPDRAFWTNTSDNSGTGRDETWGSENNASTITGGTGSKGFLGFQTTGDTSWGDSDSLRLRLFMKDSGQAFSYPTTFSEDGYTSGTFAERTHVERSSQLLSRAEWGGDFVRDWQEPYFHNYQWRNITDLGDVDRVVLAATEGNVYVSANSGGSFLQTTPDDSGQDAENIVFSPTTSRISGVEFFNQFYMCDGTKYLVLDVPKRNLQDWSILCKALGNDDSPTGDPIIPGGANDSDDPKCSLITRHMGRLVLSGYAPFPNNWFMSDYYTDSIEVGHGPNNWDVTNGAVSGTSTGLPEIGEPIKAMFPFREEALVFGCLNSISLLQGDPGDENGNATITSISRDIGIIGPDAWAHGPNRSLFFFGTNGLYYLSPNEFNVSQTNRLSVGRMDREFASIDLAKFDVKLVYDYYLYGLHIFMSPKQAATGSTRHYFYDERSQAMWPMEYPESVGPAACVYYPDPSPANRRVLLGGYDGHVRYFDPLATSDDGTAIDSYVWIGPFQVGPVTESKIMRIAAVLDAQSPNLNWGIYVGDTAEEAKSSTPVATGEWKSGRNLWKHVRARGQNIYVKIFSNTSTALPWSLENITATLAVAGRVRERN